MSSNPDAAKVAAYPPTRMLTVVETVLYLLEVHGVRTTVKTMRQWRYERRGPVAVVITGRTMYAPADIDSWVHEQITKSRASQRRASEARL